MKELNKLVKDILITKLFNKIVICCKMFHKKSMKVFKKTELHEENEITLFLYLLMQGFKNYVKLSCFSLQKKFIIFIHFLLFRKILCVLQQIFIENSLSDIIKVFSNDQLFFIHFSEICWIS